VATQLSQIVLDADELALLKQWAQHNKASLLWLDENGTLVAATKPAGQLLKHALPAGLPIVSLLPQHKRLRGQRLLEQIWKRSKLALAANKPDSGLLLALKPTISDPNQQTLHIRFSQAVLSTAQANRSVLCCTLSDVTPLRSRTLHNNTGKPLAGQEHQLREKPSGRYTERLIQLAAEPPLAWPESLHRILELACDTLKVTKASFWRLYSEAARMECEAAYAEKNGLEVGSASTSPSLSAKAYPAFFAWIAQKQLMVASNVKQHAAWQPLHMTEPFTQVISAMCLPVWVGSKVKGVLCFETQTTQREWTDEDQSFVAHLSTLVALALNSAMLQDAEKRIERLTWLDSLTGLPNRNLLHERMVKLLDVVARRNSRMAVILMDLDRFKEVNGTYGHHLGDALLNNMAQTLHKTLGSNGWVARLGGDEFVVVVPHFSHRDELARLATRLNEALMQAEVPKGIEFSVTSSMGIAVFPDHGRSISALLKHADAAMYQAKNSGRATFQFYNPFKHNVQTREQRVAKQLEKALELQELVLHYQPQVTIQTGLPSGFEALIRWNHPERGLIFPDLFLSAIEEFGMAESLTKYVARTACKQISDWRKQGLAVPPISINITGREFCDLRLPHIIRGALEEFDLPASVLVVEVTEGSLVQDNEIAIEVFKSLSQIGVHISLDDFGMGYSSLSYLRRLPLNSIKMDRSFIKNLPDDADSAAIVRAIISMARHLNLGVVAEGVENTAQAEYLLRLGCKYAQGYLYSPALDIAGVQKYLEHLNSKNLSWMV
jgi:diguanylate cyclase (GGDEF)-like protein